MTAIPRAKIALRVALQQWLKPSLRSGWLAMLAAYRDTIDEVALFTSATHTPLPLATLREYGAILAEVLPSCRALGMRAGINHLCTLGHHSEHLDYARRAPEQHMMGPHGETEVSIFCPNHPDHRQYVWDSYVALAQARPDFLWVDDDVRLQGHGRVQIGCFCDHCLALFGEATGRAWTRETLAAVLDAGTVDERLAARRQWLAHNRRTMASLLAHIRAAVASVDPGIQLGLMTAENYYSGTAYAEWATALAGQVPAMWRPGGGFYSDEAPVGMLGKAHSIGYQTATLPATVTDIQSEIENFPYQRLKKSAAALALETAVYIGAGCTGAALNIIGTWADAVDEHLPYLDGVRAHRPFFDRVAATCMRSPVEGIWQAIHHDEYATLNVDGAWTTTPGWYGPFVLGELAEIGLPLAYGPSAAALRVLSGDRVLGFSVEELREMLAGGVLVDGLALSRLHALGLGEETGFAIAGVREDDTVEQFTDDPLNGAFAGRQRDGRQSFKWWAKPAYLLEPRATGARVLAAGIDYADAPVGNVMGVYENPRGGRVAVCGYFPWIFLQTLAKTAQMKTLARWLSRDTLPAYVASYHKIALWARRDAAGAPAVLLVNASLDAATDARVLVRGAGPMTLVRADGREEPLPPAGVDGPYAAFNLTLSAWEIAFLAPVR